MALASELLIKIDAESKGFNNEIKKIKDETRNLESQLKEIGKISGIAFAGLAGTIGLTINAYREQELATNKLNTSLANQGIYTKELSQTYQEYANQIQEITTYGDEQITAAQATMQAQIGQIPITKELSMAMADLGTELGSIDAAASLMGKSIGSSTNALARYGIHVDANATKEERMQQVLDGVNQRYKGQAEAVAAGLGGLIQLKNIIGKIAEEFGKNFSPYIIAATKYLKEIALWFKEHTEITKYASQIILIGTAFSGFITVLTGAGLALITVRKAFMALSLSMGPVSIAIVALSAGIGFLAMNWNSVFPTMQAVFEAFVNNISNLASAVGKIIKGAFTLNIDEINEGINLAKESIATGMDEYNALENKKKEENLANNQQFINNKKAQQDAARQAEKDALLTDDQVNKLAQEQSDTDHYSKINQSAITQRARYLEDEKKFGTAYATINQGLHSKAITEFQQFGSAMIEMQSSQNSTLKNIGKAFAISDIAIRTATAALAAYAWAVETIPLVGHVVGAGLAAAVIAFGAEKTAMVAAAAQGGFVPGQRGAGDSVPMMLAPGELIVPEPLAPTFMDQVAAREGSFGNNATITLQLKDNLMDFIEANLVERSNLNLSIQAV